MPELRPSLLERQAEDSEEILLWGQVYDKEIKENYQILYLKNNSVKCREQFLKESQLMIYDKQKKQVCIGQKVRVNGEIGFFDSARNPGNFDQKLYYERKGIHVCVWASDLLVTENKKDILRNELYEFRQYCRNIYTENMSKEEAAVLSAVLLGEKGGMASEVKELYQANGIGHVLAISGLHLSFIGVGIYQILRRLTGSYTVGGIVGGMFLFLYVLMIGVTISVMRALVMFLFRVGADLVGRHYDSPTALSVAAVAVLVWRPLAIYDGGFWLSFGAVVAAIVILPFFSSLPIQGLWASISIQVMLFPVLLYYFYEFSLYSIILNLFVIPLMSILLAAGIFGGMLCAFANAAGGLIYPGKLLLKVCEWILWLYEKSCDIALEIPGARVVTGKPQLWQVAVYYALLVMAGILWRYVKKNGAGKLAGLVLLVAGTIFLVYPFGRAGSLNITMLDVGQGDGIFMRAPSGTTYFIDGGSSDVKNVGKYRIESCLLSKGVKRLDYVFLSHGDSDHRNGIQEMLARQRTGVEIGVLVLPCEEVWDDGLKRIAGEAQKEGVKVVVMEPGRNIEEEKLRITCLQPGDDYEGEKGNEASMVLAVTFGKFDMLLTGDVEGEGEKGLIDIIRAKYPDTRWEVLKTAHHGSKNSSSEEFLELVKPTYAMISAGRENQYGHPHEETLERLADIGCKIYNTQESGAVEVVVKDDKMKIGGFLDN